MSEKQSPGELMVNGDFATGDFSGWTNWTDDFMSVLPLEGRNVALLKPTGYKEPPNLTQKVDSDRPDGDYVFSYWMRTSDENGNELPGTWRWVTIQFYVHPLDYLGPGQIHFMDTIAFYVWVKRSRRFSIRGRKLQQFQPFFWNEARRPANAAARPVDLEGYETTVWPYEDSEPPSGLQDEQTECPILLRDVSIVKVAR